MCVAIMPFAAGNTGKGGGEHLQGRRNHYYYYQAGNLASFGWKEECDLHPLIKEEVEKAFKDVFVH